MALTQVLFGLIELIFFDIKQPAAISTATPFLWHDRKSKL